MRVIHFEVASKDPEALGEFLTDVFGWKISQWEGKQYWLIGTGSDSEAGIDGAIVEGDGGNNAVVMSVSVANLDMMMKRVTDNGGKLLDKKMAIESVGWSIRFIDPQNNIWGMIQNDPEAKE